MQRPGDQLEELIRSASRQVLLVAPFVKTAVVERILDWLEPDVAVELFTRWRPEEIVAGVSDLGVWDALQRRPASCVWLCRSLHGKLYSSDTQSLVGSANLTHAALGWSSNSNMELLVPCPLSHVEIESFLSQLRRESVRASQELRNQLQLIVDELELTLPQPLPALLVAEEAHPSSAESIESAFVTGWIPQLHEPDGLYLAYRGDFDDLTRRGREAARNDLAALGLRPGLDETQFRLLVAGILLQLPVICAIDAAAAVPQRFGAVVDIIQEVTGEPRNRATHHWQGIMRWLLYFLPDRYGRRVDRHTEMFFRKLPG